MSIGMDFLRLDGSTPAKDRLDLCDKFNRDPTMPIMLISTLAGGVGINLQSANIVVIFDPHWNPSHDLQAQDRAYRIGQQRDVKVYRLISAGSIEVGPPGDTAQGLEADGPLVLAGDDLRTADLQAAASQHWARQERAAAPHFRAFGWVG